MEIFEKPPINGFTASDPEFVTVVSVGAIDDVSKTLPQIEEDSSSGYVTVLTIGDDEPSDKTEEVLVYRLPGERLGFGLKFEGGTKASEFVKRLFIQSCAPDSPASRVHSSWGCLIEGDEVLEIDSIPVKSMTRIDCVRCLKDSNVVIKLLVKHSKSDEAKISAKPEDLPLVISAEKKRTPPPPPPVPPRKIPRKMCRENGSNVIVNNVNNNKSNEGATEVSVLPTKQPAEIGIKSRLQSPRSSARLLQPRQSPEVIKRVRKLSDGSIGPPNAEVYVDLFSQESAYCLSESDDTGSSISTVVDRFASFPTTTTSSFAGSLPSTPTAMQKQMDLSNVLNPFDDDFAQNTDNYLFTKLVSLQESVAIEEPLIEKIEKPIPLQPPANFQDAPLSYGDEDVRIVEAAIKTAIETNEIPTDNGALEMEVENNAMNGIHKAHSSKKVDDIIIKTGMRRPPPPPPRSKHQPKEKNNNDYDAKNEYSENLPRLVDFVPKNTKAETFECVKKFLENERIDCNSPYQSPSSENEENSYTTNIVGNWSEGTEFYTFNWSPSSQLATIGEVEEEGLLDSQLQRSPNSSTPIVIVENTDENTEDRKDDVDGLYEPSQEINHAVAQSHEANANNAVRSFTPSDVEVMEAPSINSRQPPDGHEFPDYQEAPIITKTIMSDVPSKLPPRPPYTQQSRNTQNSVRNIIAKFSNSSLDENVPDGESNDSYKKDLSKSVMNINTNQSSLNNYNFTPNYVSSRNALDLSISQALPEKSPELASSSTPRLHARSQSLIDISDQKSKPVTDRWSLLVEQRRKGLSKLKGLIIPEHTDPDECVPVIDLPEIKSTTPLLPPAETKPLTFQIPNHSRNSSTPSLTAPIWNTDNSNAIPTYSPAFKRKSLQVYSREKSESDKPLAKSTKQALTSQVDDDCRLPVTLSLTDAPKSLESITSPTRSDCSFEYVSSSPELKGSAAKIAPRKLSKPKEDMGKSEDESDNDSAVSSSQSSYISRNSPPTSPNHLQSHFSGGRSCNMLEHETLRNKYELTSSESADSLNRRLLKPQSVEAINRKNILASAKCRSGRDLKVGSPLIQRKFDENGVNESETKADIAVKTVEKQTELPKEEVKQNKTTPKTNGVTIRTSATKVIYDRATKRNEMDTNKNVSSMTSKNNRSASVTDLRKNFEKLQPAPSTKTQATTNIKPKLSLNLTPASVPTPTKRNSLPTIPLTNNKIATNLDIMKLIDDTLKDLEESFSKDDLKVIQLCPEIPGGSVGITLAGGTDYETKEITVHRVRNESVAFRSGQIKKGDRILSINGKSMKGLTHAESILILKELVPEVILVACAGKEISTPVLTPSSRHSLTFDLSTPTPKESTPASNNKQEILVSLVKDAAGLGFSMEGGKESLQGDVPLVIKKLFTGGVAEKCGQLRVGDELLQINGADVTAMPRIDAWTFMKKLPAGEIAIKVRR